MNHIIIDPGDVRRYALIRDGVVVQVVHWDGDPNKWQAPADVQLVLVDEGWGFGVGDLYIDGMFYRPVPPDPEVDADGYMVQNGVRMTDGNGQWAMDHSGELLRMKRKYAEVNETGTVVDIHEAETKGNRGADAKEPKTKINTKKPTHVVKPSLACNKGDKWSDKHGCFLRPLTKS